ncbi:MAG TPA: hypothetical protein VGT41_04790 [Candidatus Babeliales bacterium]|nr:hypothetical protein [Candidatus Babeliales bacterium]
MNVLRKSNYALLTVLTISTCSITHTAGELVPFKPIIELPQGTYNITPLIPQKPTTQQALAVAAMDSRELTLSLSEDLLSKVVAGHVIPNAVSILASYMKNPYILLMVTEGVAVAFALSGQPILPKNMAQQFITALPQKLAMIAAPAAIGAIGGAGEVVATRLTSFDKKYNVYIKPLLAGGAVAGIATSMFSGKLSDQGKALAFAGLYGVATPVLNDMFAYVQNLVSPSTPMQQPAAPNQKIGITAKTMALLKKLKTPIAIALISLGAVATAQTFEFGQLSLESQALGGMTLAQIVALTELTVAREYGYRATKRIANAVGDATGSIAKKVVQSKPAEFVSNIIATPKTYGEQIVNGISSIFNWAVGGLEGFSF